MLLLVFALVLFLLFMNLKKVIIDRELIWFYNWAHGINLSEFFGKFNSSTFFTCQDIKAAGDSLSDIISGVMNKFNPFKY